MRLYAFCTLNPEKMIPCILVLERNIGTPSGAGLEVRQDKISNTKESFIRGNFSLYAPNK
jgi:hypothetical protein